MVNLNIPSADPASPSSTVRLNTNKFSEGYSRICKDVQNIFHPVNKTKAESESVENIKTVKIFWKIFPSRVRSQPSWTSVQPACCHQGVFHTFKFRPELSSHWDCSAQYRPGGKMSSPPHPCSVQRGCNQLNIRSNLSSLLSQVTNWPPGPTDSTAHLHGILE